MGFITNAPEDGFLPGTTDLPVAEIYSVVRLLREVLRFRARTRDAPAIERSRDIINP